MEFNLIKCDIEEFAILEDAIPDNRDDLFIDNIITARYSSSEKTIALINTIKYIYQEKILLKTTAIFYFKFEELTWNALVKDDKILLEKEAFQHLGIIITGAMRGILIAKCSNTIYSSIILPPVNIVELLYEDLVFEK